MTLPPYGRQFLDQRPSAGPWVAIGPGAWKFAKGFHFPVMVLPDDASPCDFRWPSDGKAALIHERGVCDDNRLRAMAEALIQAGAPSVVALREALADFTTRDDPRVFFDPEVLDVTA